MSSSLATLPQEILDEIISRLPARTDLSSLSTTSKSIRAATVESLFKDITMIWRHNAEHGHKVAQPRINFLLRTLLAAPKFADHVSIINIQAIGYRWRSLAHRGTKPQLPLMTISRDHAVAVDQALKRMGFDTSEVAERLRQGIVNNEFDAVVALLLLICPEITRLELGLDVLINNGLLPHVLLYGLPGEMSTKSSRFQYVKSLSMGSSLDPRGDALTYLVRYPERQPNKMLRQQAYLPLLYLPALEHAEISLPGPAKDQTFHWPTATPPRLMALSSLCLPRCSCSPEVLCHILAYAPHLAHLEYDCWLHSRNRFDASALKIALNAVKNTLTHLRLNIQFWSNETAQPSELQDTWVQGKCSLRQMVALEMMSVPLSILTGWNHDSTWALADVVPPNISSMSIMGDCGFYESWGWEEEEIMSRLHDFVAQGRWREAATRLRHIEFTHPDWEDVQDFEASCTQNGLSCVVRPAEFPMVI